MSEHTIESTSKYAVGDVVNNHRLGADGTWSPLVQAPPPPVAQITPATLSEIILPSKKKSFGKRLVIGLAVGIAIIVIGSIVGGAVSGGSKSGGTSPNTSTSQGLNDPTKLDASVKASYQASFDKGAPGAKVTNVTCVPSGIEHQFSCLITGTDTDGSDINASHTVTVTAAGDNWVAAAQG